MKLSSILGLNARSRLFSYEYGTAVGKRTARSKILTKRMLHRHEIPTPELYKVFRKFRDVLEFDWESLPSSFALKPSKGFGGEGIIVVVKKRLAGKAEWITTQRKRVGVEDLKLHTTEILEGAYSVGNIPDVAFCEEYVGRHKAFAKLAWRTTPDIRVIVFNRVPVMAMLRLPTKDSGGRANLHQGAIGVGVDIGTGITTHAVWYGQAIQYKPGTSMKFGGVKIPYWIKVLDIAVKAQQVSGLGFAGVDIVLHPEKGPQILELNAYPGLQIQLANMTGLRKRLERVEDLDVRDEHHGVRIAQELFTGRFSKFAGIDSEAIKRINVLEKIKVEGRSGVHEVVIAKVDTGAWRTSIDRTLARRLGLLGADNILWTRRVKSAFGVTKRPVVNLTFWLARKRVKTSASVANREGLRTLLIIGRRDLAGFSIVP